jgi:hypothetical protein
MNFNVILPFKPRSISEWSLHPKFSDKCSVYITCPGDFNLLHLIIWQLITWKSPCYVSRSFICSLPSLQKLGIIDYPIPTHFNPDKILARKNPSQLSCKLNNHYVFTAHISGINFNIILQSKSTFVKMSHSMTFSNETFVRSLVPRKLSSIQMKILE